MNNTKNKSTLRIEDENILSPYHMLAEKSQLSMDNDDNWLITLSDLFSLLLIFLIMFLVMSKNVSNTNSSKSKAVHSAMLPYEELKHKTDIIGDRLRDSIVSEISNLDLGDEVSILATNREIIITMREKISFMPGDAQILQISKPVLDNIADIIKRNAKFLVEIVGHTDNVPIRTRAYPSNWELSVARASSVLKYLITEHKIDPSRLSIKGNADQTPFVPNNTPENRAKNRRVEIKLKEIES